MDSPLLSDTSEIAMTYAIGPIWTCLVPSLKDGWNGPIHGAESAGTELARSPGLRMASALVEPRFLIYSDI